MKKNYGYKKLFNKLFDEEFTNLSITAKFLFCLIADRMNLSIINDYIDSNDRFYVVFSNAKICEKCKCSHSKATKLLCELEHYNLIIRKKRGQGRADIIFLTEKALKIIESGNCTQNMSYKTFENKVKKQIEYDVLIERYNDSLIDDFVKLIVDIYITKKTHIRIGKNKYKTEYIQRRFKDLSAENIEYVISSIDKIDKPIKNMRSYLITSLYYSIDTTAIADYFAKEGD